LEPIRSDASNACEDLLKAKTMSDINDEQDFEMSDDVEAALRRQDEALALLDRLRAAEPYRNALPEGTGGGRRDFRRWPTPDGVTLELHDGERWSLGDCLDMGVGGARMASLPVWAEGPVPARLQAPELPNAVLVLADIMWRDGVGGKGKAGLRFEFQDDEERDAWSGALIDALLARHALG